MRILIDNSGYHLRNMGDVAMLQSAASRLRKRYPGCELLTLTSDGERLSRFVGGTAVDDRSRHRWKSSRVVPIPLRKSWLPKRIASLVGGLDDIVRDRTPRCAASLVRALGWVPGFAKGQDASFFEAVASADLVVATGGGFFTDSFLGHANGVLDTIELAQKLGKRTALFGQGIGPLECVKTRRRLGKIVSRAEVVGLRESRAGTQILSCVGVPPQKMKCTGDDAIQLAYEHRAEKLGDDIGVNVRVTGYSMLSEQQRAELRNVLLEAGKDRAVALRSVPISFYGHESDVERIKELIGDSANFCGYDGVDDPLSVIQAISRCRLVVTGSYHAGVFALSQGISVIGLSASPYYSDKFHGLAAQFGIGCDVVELGRPGWVDRLRRTMVAGYTRAHEKRDVLLGAASLQSQWSQEIYAAL